MNYPKPRPRKNAQGNCPNRKTYAAKASAAVAAEADPAPPNAKKFALAQKEQSFAGIIFALAANAGQVNDKVYPTSPPWLVPMLTDTKTSINGNQKLELDSSTTHHFLPDISYFVSLSSLNIKITLANNSQYVSNGIAIYHSW